MFHRRKRYNKLPVKVWGPYDSRFDPKGESSSKTPCPYSVPSVKT